MLLAISH